MARDSVEELQDKIARFEALARQFSDGPTYANIQKEIEALRQRLAALIERR